MSRQREEIPLRSFQTLDVPVGGGGGCAAYDTLEDDDYDDDRNEGACGEPIYDTLGCDDNDGEEQRTLNDGQPVYDSCSTGEQQAEYANEDEVVKYDAHW